MTLIELRNFIAKQKVVNLFTILKHFSTNVEKVKPMLDYLLAKHNIRICKRPDGCGSQCGKCDSELRIIYEWVDS